MLWPYIALSLPVLFAAWTAWVYLRTRRQEERRREIQAYHAIQQQIRGNLRPEMVRARADRLKQELRGC